ncbi:hypothetical protein D9615_000663 [Tricholomella constricta]|uniref:C2H2-type domain-containing protein n=1 Tax=Tricholomella constricta TaxID=117010 RepID=A0A8H5MBM7_9AGAR|nr:hypothetical protein D9615_000663 [Tricholomella constricta]
MSIGRPNVQLTLVSEEQYRENQARIEQAQATLDNFKAMNDAAKQAYEKQQELIRKIEEGKEAERQLLALANASGTGRLSITGPSNPQITPYTNYYTGWQYSNSQTAGRGEQQINQGNVNGYGAQPQQQWQAYRASSNSHMNYPAQASSSSNTSQGYPGMPPQQVNQQYYQRPQAAPSTRQGLDFAPSPERGQYQPQPTQRIPQMNGRTASGPMRQAASTTQRRQALPMQPVMQQSLQSNQFQMTSAQLVHPAPFAQLLATSQTTSSQGTDQSQHFSYTPAVASGSSVPNFVDQIHRTRLHSHRPPSAPGSSSLAGALDAPQRVDESTSVPSSSNVPLSATTQPFSTSPGTMATISQEQVTASNSSSSSSVPAPASTMGPSAPAGSSAASSEESSIRHPVIPLSAGSSGSGTEDPVAFLKRLTANSASMERLERLAEKFTSGAKPKTFLSLPNSTVRIYKDVDSKLFLIFPDPSRPTGFSFLPLPTLLSMKAQGPAKRSRNVYRDEYGNFQFLQEPLTQEQAKKYRPYSIPPHATIQSLRSQAPGTSTTAVAATSNGSSNSVTVPVLPTSATTASTSISTTFMSPSTPTAPLSASGPSIRTPAQADKKRLAKDLLRALSFSSHKRSHPEDGPSPHPLEPPAKRHASGQGTQASTPVHDESTTEANGGAVPSPQAEPSSLRTQQRSHYSTGSHADVQPPAGPSGQYYRPWVLNPSAFSKGSSSETVSLPTPSISRPSPPAAEHETSVTSPFETPQSPPPIFGSSTLTAQDETVIASSRVPTKSSSRSPPPDDAAPASTIFLPQRAKTPLFLPSPSSSPFVKPTGVAVEEIFNDLILDDTSSSSRQVPRSQPFYILVPPLPDYVLRHRTRRLRKRRRLSTPVVVMDEIEPEVEEISSSDTTMDDEEDVDTDPASNGFVNDDAELEAVRFSCSRLSERPCKWNGCNAVLSSTEKLIQHFASAHRWQRTFKGFYVCLWQHCGRHERNSVQLFHHLKSHATIPLSCAYNDCRESFKTPRQLAKHHQSEHSNAMLKPSTALFTPTLEPLPEAPNVIPSYLIEPTVRQASISKERHAALGPWVLRNIAGPVNLGIRRYNAASKLTRTSSGEGVKRSGNQQYDFLNFPSTNFSTTPSQPSKIRGMANLESGEVSEMVYDGMVLWNGPDEPKIEETDKIEELFSSPVPEPERDEVDELDEDFPTEHKRDEEAVEIMLAMS